MTENSSSTIQHKERRSVGLIMTVLNEERSLPAFLESLASQIMQPEEIVVVDGGSLDRTVELLREWSSPTGIRIRVVVAPGVNISEGRNLAIRESLTDYVAITDGGTRLRSNWLLELVETLEVSYADVVGGFFAPTGSTRFQRSLAAAITPRVQEIRPEEFLPSSRSLLVSRSAWEAVGGYPEWLDYCEDLVFDLSLKERGFTFAFSPGAIVEWDARPDLRSFAKQYYRYARGDGKANLWWKRHAMRYAAYGTGGALLAAGARDSRLWIILGLLSVGYLGKPVRRVLAADGLSTATAAVGVISVPLVVIVGDAAKMLGYPVGLFWHLRNPGHGS